MGMMLPNELVWIMQKLGFEWPDIDEDEIRRAATIVRTFGGELEGVIQSVDRVVNNDLATALRGQTGPATVAAWNTTRSQNLQRLVDIMPPAATAMDVGAGVVLGLKIKVIADVTTTALALIGMLTNPITAAGAGPMLIIKKKLLNAAVDTVVEELVAQLAPMVIEPLADELPAIIDAVLDAPVVEGQVGDSDEFYADLQALGNAQAALNTHSTDLQQLTGNFIADLASLDFGGDAS